MRVKLSWNDTTLTRASAGSTKVLNFGIRSSAYDPDPAALTGSIPGFVELANLYEFYRVHKMVAVFTVSNNEPNGITIGAWPSSVIQNVNSLTDADCLEFAGNVGGKITMMGNNNSPPKTVRVIADGRSLLGRSFQYDLDYSASTSSNPPIMYGINFFAVSNYGNFSYAINTRLKVVYHVEFFTRRQLET